MSVWNSFSRFYRGFQKMCLELNSIRHKIHPCLIPRRIYNSSEWLFSIVKRAFWFQYRFNIILSSLSSIPFCFNISIIFILDTVKHLQLLFYSFLLLLHFLLLRYLVLRFFDMTGSCVVEQFFSIFYPYIILFLFTERFQVYLEIILSPLVVVNFYVLFLSLFRFTYFSLNDVLKNLIYISWRKPLYIS